MNPFVLCYPVIRAFRPRPRIRHAVRPVARVGRVAALGAVAAKVAKPIALGGLVCVSLLAPTVERPIVPAGAPVAALEDAGGYGGPLVLSGPLDGGYGGLGAPLGGAGGAGGIGGAPLGGSLYGVGFGIETRDYASLVTVTPAGSVVTDTVAAIIPVGTGTDKDATPVPEPDTLALFAGFLFILVVAIRWTKKESGL